MIKGGRTGGEGFRVREDALEEACDEAREEACDELRGDDNAPAELDFGSAGGSCVADVLWSVDGVSTAMIASGVST